ncbi:MAG TPA: ABC transporter permease [Candidatus Acidoferrales bacterium]|nr:ABC transporter permease [Candidatus Acidoferrales bacterium]
MAIFDRLFARRKIREELSAEMCAHLEEKTRELMDAGTPPREAEFAVRRLFGNTTKIEELGREVWRLPKLESLIADVRFALRGMRKNPGFAAVAVLTLALGIGANTAIFSVVNAVMLIPLPYSHPERLAMLWTDNAALNLHEVGTGYPIIEEWRRLNSNFSALAVCSRNHPVSMGTSEGTERLDGAAVSGNLFDVLGVAPELGRAITADDEKQAARVVVLSHGLWVRRFGADPDAVGKSAVLNGHTTTIVGVMPDAFKFPSDKEELWEPVTSLQGWENSRTYVNSHFWIAIGRLKPGSTVAAAQAEMTGIGHILERKFPVSDNEKNSSVSFGVNVVPFSLQFVPPSARRALWILFVAVGFVLMIALANTANLLFARGIAREKEFALRLALGAGRTRLARQVFVEGLVLAALSAAAGMGIASIANRLLIASAPRVAGLAGSLRVDSRVLLFTVGCALISACVCGFAPLWAASGRAPQESLKESSRGIAGNRNKRFFRNALVTCEISLALVLLTGTGLLVRSLLRIERLKLGFDPSNVLMMKLEFPRSKSDAQTLAFYNSFIQRVNSLPGVRASGVINSFLIESNPDVVITVEGGVMPEAGQLEDDVVSAGYFTAMGIPLVAGRLFSFEDSRTGQPVAIVNETMAERFWPDTNPVGMRFRYGDAASREPWITVVGVVGDVHRQGLEREVIPQFFLPHSQSPGPGMLRDMTLMVKTSVEPKALARPVRDAAWSLDKTVSIYRVETLETEMSRLLAARKFNARALSTFAAIAMLLAAVGVYGLLRYLVGERTQEIGIRLTLGASSGQVFRMIMCQAGWLVGAGVLIGGAGSIGLARVMGAMLYGTDGIDAIALVAASTAICAVGLIASYIPARRAMKIEPVLALRQE